MKKFDLNIEEILEDWEVYHALREIIANALDEQALTSSKDIDIFSDRANSWHIRDFGRGLKYEHLTQKENTEKIHHPHLIGKFGVGLKDALATLDRRGANVLIRSRFGEITLGKAEKRDFSDIVTLHAYLSPASEPQMQGTDFVISGCSATDVEQAKNLFLAFSDEQPVEQTALGDVLTKDRASARIFINGVLVAEEDNFLFSYNITSLTTAIKKALNRERTNVGRSAYADRVKAILVACQGKPVADALTADLDKFETGEMHDELKWTDVSAHAIRILNANKPVVFMTPSELTVAPSAVDEARSAGIQVVTVPEKVRDRIADAPDIMGNPVQDLTRFNKALDESFEFRFVDPSRLTSEENLVFNATRHILALVGGQPRNVRDIRISETMRKERLSFVEAAGLWQSDTGTIIIKRQQLRNLEQYASTLLHEVAHAQSGAPDISSGFEQALTAMIGKICGKLLAVEQSPIKEVTARPEPLQPEYLPGNRLLDDEGASFAALYQKRVAEQEAAYERRLAAVYERRPYLTWIVCKLSKLLDNEMQKESAKDG